MLGCRYPCRIRWTPVLSQGPVIYFLRDCEHYDDVIMGAIASQITSLTIVYSTVYSDADRRKHQSSASLAFVWVIQRRPVNSPHKCPVTRKMFPFHDVIMNAVCPIIYARGIAVLWFVFISTSLLIDLCIHVRQGCNFGWLPSASEVTLNDTVTLTSSFVANIKTALLRFYLFSNTVRYRSLWIMRKRNHVKFANYAK